MFVLGGFCQHTVGEVGVATGNEEVDARHAANARVAVPPAADVALVAVAREDVRAVKAALLAVAGRAAAARLGRRAARFPLPGAVYGRDEEIERVLARIGGAALPGLDPCGERDRLVCQ